MPRPATKWSAWWPTSTAASGRPRRRARWAWQRLAADRAALSREVLDGDLDHRRVGRHLVDVLIRPGVLHDPIGDLASFHGVRDDASCRREVGLGRSLQVDRETRVLLQVVQPRALVIGARRAGDD